MKSFKKFSSISKDWDESLKAKFYKDVKKFSEKGDIRATSQVYEQSLSVDESDEDIILKKVQRIENIKITKPASCKSSKTDEVNFKPFEQFSTKSSSNIKLKEVCSKIEEQQQKQKMDVYNNKVHRSQEYINLSPKPSTKSSKRTVQSSYQSRTSTPRKFSDSLVSNADRNKHQTVPTTSTRKVHRRSTNISSNSNTSQKANTIKNQQKLTEKSAVKDFLPNKITLEEIVPIQGARNIIYSENDYFPIPCVQSSEPECYIEFDSPYHSINYDREYYNMPARSFMHSTLKESKSKNVKNHRMKHKPEETWSETLSNTKSLQKEKLNQELDETEKLIEIAVSQQKSFIIEKYKPKNSSFKSSGSRSSDSKAFSNSYSTNNEPQKTQEINKLKENLYSINQTLEKKISEQILLIPKVKSRVNTFIKDSNDQNLNSISSSKSFNREKTSEHISPIEIQSKLESSKFESTASKDLHNQSIVSSSKSFDREKTSENISSKFESTASKDSHNQSTGSSHTLEKIMVDFLNKFDEHKSKHFSVTKNRSSQTLITPKKSFQETSTSPIPTVTLLNTLKTSSTSYLDASKSGLNLSHSNVESKNSSSNMWEQTKPHKEEQIIKNEFSSESVNKLINKENSFKEIPNNNTSDSELNSKISTSISSIKEISKVEQIQSKQDVDQYFSQKESKIIPNHEYKAKKIDSKIGGFEFRKSSTTIVSSNGQQTPIPIIQKISDNNLKNGNLTQNSKTNKTTKNNSVVKSDETLNINSKSLEDFKTLRTAKNSISNNEPATVHNFKPIEESVLNQTHKNLSHVLQRKISGSDEHLTIKSSNISHKSKIPRLTKTGSSISFLVKKSDSFPSKQVTKPEGSDSVKKFNIENNEENLPTPTFDFKKTESSNRILDPTVTEYEYNDHLNINSGSESLKLQAKQALSTHVKYIKPDITPEVINAEEHEKVIRSESLDNKKNNGSDQFPKDVKLILNIDPKLLKTSDSDGNLALHAHEKDIQISQFATKLEPLERKQSLKSFKDSEDLKEIFGPVKYESSEVYFDVGTCSELENQNKNQLLSTNLNSENDDEKIKLLLNQNSHEDYYSKEVPDDLKLYESRSVVRKDPSLEILPFNQYRPCMKKLSDQMRDIIDCDSISTTERNSFSKRRILFRKSIIGKTESGNNLKQLFLHQSEDLSSESDDENILWWLPPPPKYES